MAIKPGAIIFLQWLRERCKERCDWSAVMPDGKFTGEGYLNIIHDCSINFPGVFGIVNPGMNLAPWNIKKHKITNNNGSLVVDNFIPLICFHYRKFKNPNKIDENYEEIESLGYLNNLLFKPYHNALIDAIKTLHKNKNIIS